MRGYDKLLGYATSDGGGLGVGVRRDKGAQGLIVDDLFLLSD